MSSMNQIHAKGQLGESFRPHEPTNQPELLAGRSQLLNRARDAVNTQGLHIILYGDRGMGKTSVAHAVGYLVQEADRPDGCRVVLASCDSNDDYRSLWHKAFQEVKAAQPQMGFKAFADVSLLDRADVGEALDNPNAVRRVMQSLPNPSVFIFDEFDRLPNRGDIQRLMGDTIKLFADFGVRTTLILVGVAESITDLIGEHASVGRHIAQIQVAPMTAEELAEIIQKGFNGAGLVFDEGLDRRIADLSQGYPHFTHLLGQWSGRRAVEAGRNRVTFNDLDQAISDVLDNATGGVQQQWQNAVAMSAAQTVNLSKSVLLACALAHKDSVGRFSVVDLKEPLKKILNRDPTTVGYHGVLARFCDSSQGPVLLRTGSRNSYRWQFVNPQFVPYIRLHWIRGSAERAPEDNGSSLLNIRAHQALELLMDYDSRRVSNAAANSLDLYEESTSLEATLDAVAEPGAHTAPVEQTSAQEPEEDAGVIEIQDDGEATPSISKLVTTMPCPRCGHQNARFAPSCGRCGIERSPRLPGRQ